MIADFLVRGAWLADGENPVRPADVAVCGARVGAVGSPLEGVEAREVIDAAGLLMCPGFIDMHAHSALEPFLHPELEPKIAQGFTTELLHPDGLAPAPVDPDRVDERRAYLRGLEGAGPDRWDWSTFGEYLDRLSATGPATDLVPSIGHCAVRDLVLGSDDRAPTAEELQAMRDAVREGLEAGARTVSFGMIYLPGLYAATEELEALAEEAADAGVPLVPHVRNEAAGVLEAIDEFVGVARRTGAALHISHLKIVGNPELLDGLLALLDAARSAIDITFDQYPYGAGCTLLTALLPPWALDGGPRRVLARLQSDSGRATIARDMRSGLRGWENLYGACGPEGIMIAHAGRARPEAIGRTLADIGDERRCDPIGAALDLLRDTGLDVTMVDHYASEDTVRAIFRHPLGLVGSDGIFGAHPHPRLYGTAARVLGRYALRERIVSVEEAVARLSARAADRLRLRDRGRVCEGLRADLVLLDPERFVDVATYDEPCRTPPGVVRVFNAGRPVWADGSLTGERPGQVVREARTRAKESA